VNIMMFCKEYNARTQDQAGTIIPVEITVFEVRARPTEPTPIFNPKDLKRETSLFPSD